MYENVTISFFFGRKKKRSNYFIFVKFRSVFYLFFNYLNSLFSEFVYWRIISFHGTIIFLPPVSPTKFHPVWSKLILHLIRAVWTGSMLFAFSFSTCNRVCRRKAWILIRLRGCAGWSGSMLVANALCWFCHDAAHFTFFTNRQSIHLFKNTQKRNLWQNQRN
jgi:hypothetical protein